MIPKTSAKSFSFYLKGPPFPYQIKEEKKKEKKDPF